MFIPLSVPNFEGNERKYVDDAIDQGWVSTGGAYITKLEQELAKFLEVPNVAACQSGTAALHLSLIECGVGPGDVVLVPPLTFTRVLPEGTVPKAPPPYTLLLMVPPLTFTSVPPFILVWAPKPPPYTFVMAPPSTFTVALPVT